jgi:NAD(P)-dependent dehydrogenase (short-subunit alcohol dehydrogenase family)
MTDLEGRRAVVVGGASGIGAAVVSLLRSRGADVVVADIRAEDGVVACDVTDESSVVALFEGLDRLDIAVNCAGVSGRMGPITDLSLDTWRGVLDVNLTGAFLCLREELRKMVPQGSGAIVTVSSGAGLRGLAQLPDYVASKHGVIGLVRAAALEHARAGIRVNAVAPGSIHTPMLAAFVDGDEKALAGMGRMSPVGRLGTADEVAEAIVWLCSDEARFVTGSVLSVDGGVSAA